MTFLCLQRLKPLALALYQCIYEERLFTEALQRICFSFLFRNGKCVLAERIILSNTHFVNTETE